MGLAPGRKRGHGMSLGVTVAIIAIAIAAVMTLCANCTLSMQASTALSNSQQAANLADRALSAAISAILSSQGLFGTHPQTDAVHLSETAYSGADVVFGMAPANDANAPFSINNLLSQSNAVNGWNHRNVPPTYADLLAVGYCRNSRVTTEVMLQLQPLSFAIGCNADVLSTQGFMVGGVPSKASLPPDWSNLLSADVLSNSADAVAITVPRNSYVAGNAKAVGGIQAAPNTVKGSLLSGSASQTLPTLNIGSFDPAAYNPPPSELTAQSNATTVQGWNRSSGDVHISGDLNLSNAVLYVPGSLTVDGGIQGKGAVFTTGSQTYNNQHLPFDADNTVALAAQGNLTVRGNDAEHDLFSGMVYAGGNLDLEHVSILGVAVATGPSSSVTMNDARVAAVPQMASITITPSPVPTAGPPAAQGPPYAGSTRGPFPVQGSAPPVSVGFVQIDYYLDATGAGVAYATLLLAPDAQSPPTSVIGTTPALPANYSAANIAGNDPTQYGPSLALAGSMATSDLFAPYASSDTGYGQALTMNLLSTPGLFIQWPNPALAAGLPPVYAPPTPGTTATGPPPPPTLLIDLSQFLAIAERTRLEMWRRL